MIDPTKMTRYGLSKAELEETILFAVLAANSDAVRSAESLERLLRYLYYHLGYGGAGEPFGALRAFLALDFQLGNGVDNLRQLMKRYGIGKHGMKTRAFVELATCGLDLKTCSPEDLEGIYGIGFKTSRFFILHTRPNAQVAALDTHILAYMRDQGLEAPKASPGSAKKYKQFEEQFLELADVSGMSVADFDLLIWNKYSKNGVK